MSGLREVVGSLWALMLFTAFGISAEAQSTKISSTLRYGSGLLDVPVASVLPHRTIVTTYSGFFTSNESEWTVDETGAITGTESFEGGWRGDLAVAIGLWDLLELGATVQSLEGEREGGKILGGFGRLTLVHPQKNGLGLAVGLRALSSPGFGDGIDLAPTRLGVADRRFRDELEGEVIGSELSFYAVASMDLPGVETDLLPAHDWTVTGGRGSGMFSAGEGAAWYEFSDSGGWFVGLVLHLQLRRAAMLNIMSEYNGFDWNVGTQLDFRGVRLGAHLLGVNYSDNVSLYRSRKLGFSASVAVCPPGLCRAALTPRAKGDPIILPPPPPDTVLLRPEPPPEPEGEALSLCLANGVAADVFVTTQGDTLVGPMRVSLRDLRPAVDLAGRYAGGESWFSSDEPVSHDGRDFVRAGQFLRLNCAVIERVGEYLGIPLFAVRGAEGGDVETLYLPVRPGVWQAYRARDPDA